MLWRLGPGPVFWAETRAAARRRRGYAARAAFAAALWLVPLAGWWVGSVQAARLAPVPPDEVLRWVSRLTVRSLVMVLVTFALLAGPPAAADALGRRRARGPLGQLLVTDLSAAEVVLGAAAARVASVLALLLAATPVALLIVVGYDGDPEMVLAAAAVALAVAALGAALAAALSLWLPPYAALLVVYGLWGLWLESESIWIPLAGTAPPLWLEKAHPYALSGRAAARTLADVAHVPAGALAIGSAALGLAALRLRAVAGADGFRRPTPWRRRLARLRRLVPGPSLDADPVAWLATRLGGRSAGATAFWALYALVFGAWGVVTFLDLVRGRAGQWPMLVAVAGYSAGVGLLAVAVRAGASWSAHRDGGPGAFDVLLTTPLTGPELVGGEWRACFRTVAALAVLPAFAAAALAAAAPTSQTIPTYASPVSFDPWLGPLTVWQRLAVALVVPARVLADGAAVVSLGVYFAARLRQTSRAVAAAVVCYLGVAIFWPTAVESLVLSTDRNLSMGLGSASPLAAPIVSLGGLFNPWLGHPPRVIPAVAAWLAPSLLVAAALRGWTGRRFDRWAGRNVARGSGTHPQMDADSRGRGEGGKTQDANA